MIDSDLVEDDSNISLLEMSDNKGMMTAAHPERPIQQAVRLNITDSDKSKPRELSARKRFRLRTLFRVPYMINSFIAIVVGTLLYLLEFGIIPGTKSGFFCKDPVISHRYTGDTVSVTTLLVGSALGPLLVVFLVEALIKESFKIVRVSDVWFYYKECLIGSTFVLLITEIMKIIVGEHRPHFFDVCQPDSSKDCTSGTYVNTFTCTSTRFSSYFLLDSSRSFPSGHSSVSVFVAIYCAYVVQKRLPTARTGRLFKPFLVAVCLTWGIVCSLSRIVDKRHHWWDVLAGMSLGACGAAYTLWLLHKKIYESEKLSRTSTSTTTLLDVKNKDATSVII